MKRTKDGRIILCSKYVGKYSPIAQLVIEINKLLTALLIASIIFGFIYGLITKNPWVLIIATTITMLLRMEENKNGNRIK